MCIQKSKKRCAPNSKGAMNNTQQTERRGGCDVYQIVTDRIIQLLEQGTVPWHKAWSSDDRLPMNLCSGKPYRGVNVFLLHVAGYGLPHWLTLKQANERGGRIRPGEKSSIAVFWKSYELEDKNTGEKKTVPVLRYYRVFNVEQCEGIDYPKSEPRMLSFNPIEACERLVSGMPNPPKIQHIEARAYYRRATDTVNLPPRESFENEPEYYSTAFHELTHATGHESRLGRMQKGESNFGTGSYAKEELIAEMGAAFLCWTAGIENKTIDNSAAYIAGWPERLKNNRKLVVQAASAAHKAADYILGKSKEERE
jgi:antirestriction protein ArdC